MDETLYSMDLPEKIDKSIKILEQASNRYNNISIGFTSGKDSLVTLNLASKILDDFKVIFVDTGYHFEEVYSFIDEVFEDMDAQLITAINKDVLRNMDEDRKVKKEHLNERNQREVEKIGLDEFTVGKDRGPCCHLLKTVAFKNSLREEEIDAHINGIRWDEQESRKNEDYFSERNNHMRVHPILHWSEEDVWNYIYRNSLDYNSLYDKGYRSIGCKPCTNRVSADSESERAGRAQDKEKVMERLRDLGYM